MCLTSLLHPNRNRFIHCRFSRCGKRVKEQPALSDEKRNWSVWDLEECRQNRWLE